MKETETETQVTFFKPGTTVTLEAVIESVRIEADGLVKYVVALPGTGSKGGKHFHSMERHLFTVKQGE